MAGVTHDASFHQTRPGKGARLAARSVESALAGFSGERDPLPRAEGLNPGVGLGVSDIANDEGDKHNDHPVKNSHGKNPLSGMGQ
jgi:hypothetical protein